MPGDKRHGRRDRRLPTTGRTERRAATAIRLAIKTVRATRRRPHDDPPPAWFRGDADAVLAASRERGLEGVVGLPVRLAITATWSLIAFSQVMTRPRPK